MTLTYDRPTRKVTTQEAYRPLTHAESVSPLFHHDDLVSYSLTLECKSAPAIGFVSFTGTKLTARRAAAYSELERIVAAGGADELHSGLPVSQRVAEHAKFALSVLLLSEQSPEIFANSNGTVSLEWDGRVTAHLEIGLTRYSMYARSSGQTEYFDGRIDELYFELPRMLRSLSEGGNPVLGPGSIHLVPWSARSTTRARRGGAS